MNKPVSIELRLPRSAFDLHVRAILPELNENIGRASISWNEDESDFHIYIEAPDIVSVRPALSSINRMLVLVSRVNKEVI